MPASLERRAVQTLARRPGNSVKKRVDRRIIAPKRAGKGEEITPEEHKRRGDAADAMFQEMKRLIAAGLKRPDG